MRRLAMRLFMAPLLAVVLLAGFVLGTEGGFEWALRTAARLSDGTLQMETVTGRASGPVELTGIVVRAGGARYRIGRLRLDWRPGALLGGRVHILELALSDLDLALPGPAPEPRAAQGEGFVLPLPVVLEQGRIERLRIRPRGAAPFDIAAIDLAGRAAATGLVLERLEAALLDGSLQGQGRVDWSPELAWEFSAHVRRIDPGRQWPDWPGRLDGRLQTSGGQRPDGLAFDLAIRALGGVLRGYPVAGEARVVAGPEGYRIDAMRLVSGANRLEASGRVAADWALDWKLGITEPDALLPGWAGSFAATGRVTGPRAAPRVVAEVSGRGIRGDGLSVQRLDGRVALGAGRATQRIELDADSVEVAGRAWDRVVIGLDGTWREHRLALAADGPDAALDLTLRGGLRDRRWQGRLVDGGWWLAGAGRWRLVAPAALDAGPQRIRLAQTCFAVPEETGGRLCATLDARPGGPWSVGIDAAAVPLALFRPPQAALSGQVEGRARLTGRAGAIERGELSLRAADVRLLGTGDGLPADIRVPDARLEARLDGAGLTGWLDARLPADDYLRAELALPGWRPGVGDWQAQPVTATLSGRLRELAALKYLVQDLGRLRGEIDIDVRARGTLGRPVVAGGVQLREGGFEIDAAGVRLTGVEMDLASEPDGLSLRGRARSGDGAVTFDGRLRFDDLLHWRADLSLAGERFTVLDTAEAHVVVNPDLRAALRPPEVRLSGSIHVPEAWFRPRDLSGAVRPSRDVVVVDGEAAPPEDAPERWRVYSDILVTLGDQVRLNGFGVRGRIAGRLRLLDAPDKPTVGQGQLSIEDGTYRIYGRELDIVQGRLLFGGGPIEDPGVDFKAERKIGDIVAGVRVTGVLSDPQLNLYSDPDLPDSDILGYLSFGRPLSEVGGGSAVSGAAAAAAGTNLLAGRIGQRLGLDELRVEGGETLEEASLVLGTYLSPKLYVRYAAGFDRAVNRFEARYEFSRRWAIQTETSQEETGADVIFTFEK